MTHLTMEQLLDLRDGATEPGTAAAQDHLTQCEHCQAELDRLHQRAARLKALSTLKPPRDRWPAVRAQVMAERRRRLAWRGVGSLALAASIALMVFFRPPVPGPTEVPAPASPDPQVQLEEAMLQSRLLEQALAEYEPERRVTDGYTARVVAELEDRISALDQQLQVTELTPDPSADQQLLQLWRQRVGLMDALVSVHLTRASRVGL